jgi:choline dehydrogenase
VTPGRLGAGCFIVSAISKAAATAGAAVLADATPSAPAPSHPDLRHVLDLLPRPRKPSRSTAVQETR